MLRSQKALVASAIREALSQTFEIDHDPVIETPPRRELGDLASPAPLHLARELKQAPRKIAEQIAVNAPLDEGPNTLQFEVPADAALGQTFARFRMSLKAHKTPWKMRDN